MKTQISNLITFGKCRLCKKIKSQNGFWEYVATVAIILVIIAFVAVPTLRNFAANVFTSMATWWTNISSNVFKTT